MRLATLNVLNGRSLHDGIIDTDRIRAAAAELDVDVLCVQEVDRGQPRSHHIDIIAEMADALGAEYYRFVPALVGTPGDEWRAAHVGDRDERPAYGVGLISRWPVRSWRVLRLFASGLRAPVLIPGTRAKVMMLDDEPRVVLAAVIDLPGGPVTVATTHLSFVPGWNVRQLRITQRALRQLPGPRLLLGDLNIPAWLLSGVSRWKSLAKLPTYPVGGPHIQFDHALAEPISSLPPVVGVETPELPISDHRALVVTFAPH